MPPTCTFAYLYTPLLVVGQAHVNDQIVGTRGYRNRSNGENRYHLAGSVMDVVSVGIRWMMGFRSGLVLPGRVNP